jgi:cytoskeletal protein CcmA (bactofilin family)
LSSTPAARRLIPSSADEPPIARPADSNQHNAVTLGPRDRVIGTMYIEGDLRVGGIVEGEVEVTGDVAIDDMAKVKASVTARDVSISGQVVGAIVARKRLEVTRSGSLIGDVRVARLTIQDGATFSGKVSMGAAAEAPAKAPEAKLVVPEAKLVVPEAKLVVPEAKLVVPEAKPVVSEPAVQVEAKSTAPIVAPPMAQPPAAKAPTMPPPAAKAIVPPPAAAAKADDKAGKAKTQPPKGKPNRP